MFESLIVVAFVVGFLVFMGLLTLVAYARLYKRAEPDEAVVRTGRGGMDALAGGGMWVIPIFHKHQMLSLKQVKISINRTGDDTLVTSNKIKADVQGTMYVRVGDEVEDIKTAARTLGQVDVQIIDEMIKDKVTDVMRAEAMKLTFDDLNVKKREFGEAVGTAVLEDLKKTGLVLDSVAVTSIRQVTVDPENIPMDVYEAEGARNVVEVVEKNREETNRIRKAKEVEIQRVNVDAEKQKLTLTMDEKKAVADQEQEVAEYEATKATEARQAVLEQERIAEEAALAKEEEVKKRTIAQTEAVAVRESERDQAEKVAKAKADEAAETAEINKNKAVETAKVAKEREVKIKEVGRDRDIKVANEERQQAEEEAAAAREVAVAEKRALEAAAKATQADAEAKQIEAEEKVKTVQAKEEAERKKTIVTIQANEEREKDQIDADKAAYVEAKKAEGEAEAAKKRAEAEEATAQGKANAVKAAAEGEATAAKTKATGQADAQKAEADGFAYSETTKADAEQKAAEAKADAIIKLAAAKLEDGKAAAETKRLMVEAENAVSRELLLRDVAVAAIEQLPETVEAFMEPASAISDVKVIQLQGMGGGGEGGGAGHPNGLPGLVAKSLAESAGLVPVIQNLLSFAKETGLTDQLRDVAKGAVSEVRDTMGIPTPLAAKPEVLEAPEEGS